MRVRFQRMYLLNKKMDRAQLGDLLHALLQCIEARDAKAHIEIDAATAAVFIKLRALRQYRGPQLHVVWPTPRPHAHAMLYFKNGRDTCKDIALDMARRLCDVCCESQLTAVSATVKMHDAELERAMDKLRTYLVDVAAQHHRRLRR